MNLENLKPYLPLLIPMLVIEVIVVICTVIHILKHRNYKRGTTAIWIIVAIVGAQWCLGCIIYYLFGKGEN